MTQMVLFTIIGWIALACGLLVFGFRCTTAPLEAKDEVSRFCGVVARSFVLAFVLAPWAVGAFPVPASLAWLSFVVNETVVHPEALSEMRYCGGSFLVCWGFFASIYVLRLGAHAFKAWRSTW